MPKPPNSPFRKQGTGYYLKANLFLEIGDEVPEKSQYGYKVYEYYYKEDGLIGVIGDYEFVFVEPDTPHQRLLIKLKYG